MLVTMFFEVTIYRLLTFNIQKMLAYSAENVEFSGHIDRTSLYRMQLKLKCMIFED